MKKESLFIYFILAAVFSAAFLALAGSASAAECWSYDSSQSNCEAQSDCQWHEDTWGSWCEEKGCWNFWAESDCNTSLSSINQSCSWKSGSSGWCEQADCWQFSGPNQTLCESNSIGMNCKWEQRCVSTKPGIDCWNYDSNQSACTATEGCVWGDCYREGCWGGTSSSDCTSLTGFNGKACLWNSADSYCYEQSCWGYSNQTGCESNSCTWKYGYCAEPMCEDMSYQNTSICVNNTAGLNCQWDGSTSRCEMQGCWNYNTQNNCNAVNDTGMTCTWQVDDNGWCEQVECWSFDSMDGGNESQCVNNTQSLNCVWAGNPPGNDTEGWCYEDISSALSCGALGNEKDCMDTMRCWWDFGAQTCNDPGGDVIFEEWNPGCYIFDTNQTDCEKVIGCDWISGECAADSNIIPDNQINCTLINDSGMCNTIPALSTCCSWQGNSCAANWADQSCREQMDTPPEGATYCEDYNAYGSETLCSQIAGSPWFMPCKWDNSSKHCGFNAADVFGEGGGEGFEKIDNKMNCKAAGGKWILDTYCEGNRSVSAGRCEHKFNEERNCDKICYACEYKNDGTNHATKKAAQTSCENSRAGVPPDAPDDAAGWCQFNAFSGQATDGRWGECQQNDETKAMGGKKCSSDDCGACTFLGKVSDGSSAQICSAAGCKWFVDTLDDSNGWCGEKSDKSCSEKCEKCYDSTSCRETGSGGSGACSWDDSVLVCMPSTGSESMEICWDGADNDGNGNTDCADSKCFSDPFCGGGMMIGDFGVDCFGFDDNTGCTGAGCYWVNETWGSWCDMPGMQCFKKDGTNETYCKDDGANNDTCEWQSSGGGNCGFEMTVGCFGLNQSTCNVTNDCSWMIDDWCQNSGGWCDPDPSWTGAWYDCVQHDKDGESACDARPECQWFTDPWCSQQGANAGFCDFTGFACMQYSDNASCSQQSSCFWQDDIYSLQGGWCDMKCFNPSLDESTCTSINITNTTSCRWMGGFCDPKGFGGGMTGGGAGGGGMGASCFMHDGNESTCNSQLGCSYYNESQNAQFCDIDFSSNCPQYSYNETLCNSNNPPYDKCKYNPQMNFCDENPFECSWNSTLSSNQTLCTNSALCAWVDTSSDPWCNEHPDEPWCQSGQGHCEPACFDPAVNSPASCSAAAGGGLCSWKSGWCGSEMEAAMFQKMEKGAPIMLGSDDCGPGSSDENITPESDICGFGMKDTGEAWAFGTGVYDMSDAAACSGVYTSQGTGSGSNSTKFFWYLDTDGTSTGGCAAKDNVNIAGFEFYFRYEASMNLVTGAADETFNAYKCVGGDWGAADIKLSSKNQFMCQEINGGMVAVNKDDLNKYPTLFIPGNDLRVYVATADSSGTVSNATDTSTPGYGTPDAIDFKMECCWDPGADCDEDGVISQNDADCESILSKGYVNYEECLNGIDDDNNGLTDCFDPACICEESDCSDLPKCEGAGVNAPGYVDTTAPTLKAIRIEEYPDAALVLYDTDEPANGTLTFYNTSETCDDAASGKAVVNDSGITYSNVKKYKLWHDADLNSDTLGAPLANGSTYYYKLKMCDKAGNCGVSACLSLKTADSSKDCHFCDFVARIKVPTGWTVNYDTDRNGTYEHVQGQICGENAGMKSNYTEGRSVDVLLSKDDNSTWMKFINARLTRSGLNWKIRDISDDGISSGSSDGVGYTGLPSATRDKIINNLHPEICQVRIAGTSDELWHCNDDLDSCNQIANADTIYLNESGSDYRVWNVPYCKFSVWSGGDLGATSTEDTSSSSSSGGGGGGGGAVSTSTSLTARQVWTEVAKGSTLNMKISKQIAVTNIEFSVDKDAENVRVTVRQLESAPEDTSPFGRNVYNYISIEKTNLDSIGNAEISFKVNQSWLDAEGIKRDDIALYRFSAGWDELTTTVTGAIPAEVYYKAASPGFSYFLIGKKEGAEEPEKAAEEPPEAEIKIDEPAPEEKEDIPEPEAPPITGAAVQEIPGKGNKRVRDAAFVLAVALFIIAVAYYGRRMKNHE